VGTRVRVRPSVSDPAFGWGSVSHGEIGVISSINGTDCEIDFPSQSGWSGRLDELERVGGGGLEDSDAAEEVEEPSSFLRMRDGTSANEGEAAATSGEAAAQWEGQVQLAPEVIWGRAAGTLSLLIARLGGEILQESLSSGALPTLKAEEGQAVDPGDALLFFDK
ncbi:HERC2, partial [Symbiodinium sp. KB8]